MDTANMDTWSTLLTDRLSKATEVGTHPPTDQHSRSDPVSKLDLPWIAILMADVDSSEMSDLLCQTEWSLYALSVLGPL